MSNSITKLTIKMLSRKTVMIAKADIWLSSQPKEKNKSLIKLQQFLLDVNASSSKTCLMILKNRRSERNLVVVVSSKTSVW